MKFDFLYFIQFCMKCDKICHKQQIIHDTIHGTDKSVDKFHIIYSTKHRHKLGVHSYNTSSDFKVRSFLKYVLRSYPGYKRPLVFASCRDCPSYFASPETVCDLLLPAETVVLGK